VRSIKPGSQQEFVAPTVSTPPIVRRQGLDKRETESIVGGDTVLKGKDSFFFFSSSTLSILVDYQVSSDLMVV